MNSSTSNILSSDKTAMETKTGEVRFTDDGTRRQVFNGRCWQYLCSADPSCRVRAKFICRNHRKLRKDNSLNESSSNEKEQPKSSDTYLSLNGNRQVQQGARWQSLCRVDNCFVRAKDFCRIHRNHRLSLPTTSNPPKTSFYFNE